jgi:hypothetical protein
MPVIDQLMIMENWWYDSDVERAAYMGKKSVPMSLCPLTNSTFPGRRLNLGVHGDRLATNCLSYGRIFLKLT